MFSSIKVYFLIPLFFLEKKNNLLIKHKNKLKDLFFEKG